MPRKECKICHRHAMRRINRRGFWQQRVLPRLGFYPWECVFCRRVEFFRDNGTSHRSVGQPDADDVYRADSVVQRAKSGIQRANGGVLRGNAAARSGPPAPPKPSQQP